MSHRIEILFTGDAPDDELARARIIASADVLAATEALSKALDGLGFTHTVVARTVRTGNRAGKSGRPRLVPPEPQAAE